MFSDHKVNHHHEEEEQQQQQKLHHHQGDVFEEEYELISLVGGCSQGCWFHCDGFFVSWQGVLCLVMKGFPQPLVDLKQQIDERYAEKVFRRENPGSKWAKISIGALKDGTRLTRDQLKDLKDVCIEEKQSRAISEVEIELEVKKLSIVGFICRSLEKRWMRIDIPLRGEQQHSGITGSDDASSKVLREWDDMDAYWFHASKDGNRESNYRSTDPGMTLVMFVPSDHVSILNMIHSFRTKIDEKLPGLYRWFEDASLHITIRALDLHRL